MVLIARVLSALLCALCMLPVRPALAVPNGGFTSAGSLSSARSDLTVTALPDGSVLVVGGHDANYKALNSAELYQPGNGAFIPTGRMITARYRHTATLLPDGRILIAGGYNETRGHLDRAELYNPATGTFTPAGLMTTARADHTATLLTSGKVLIAGGFNSLAGHLAGAELYDPTTGSFTAVGNMGVARGMHTATMLVGGKVLIAGGYNRLSGYLAGAELYDPDAGTFAATGHLSAARGAHTATGLSSGKVLIAGGVDSLTYLNGAELYDADTGIFTATGSLSTARGGHTATALLSGLVLIAGGYGATNDRDSAELYDPVAGTFTATGDLATARFFHASSLLPDGTVLVTGGRGAGGTLADAERFLPASRVLTVNSVNPENGVTVALLPTDLDGNGDGATPFTRTYVQGSTVTVTAPDAAAGNSFGGWSGCTSSTGSFCTVKLDTDMAVTATYITPSYPLGIGFTGSGGGAVNSVPGGLIACTFPPQAGTCSTSRMRGTTLTLTATPDSDSLFVGWGGECIACPAASCEVTVNGTTACTAIFNFVESARLDGVTPRYFATLQAAYVEALSGDVVEARDFTFVEDLYLNQGKSITIRGGFDAAYSKRDGYSLLRGTMIVGTGSVVIDRLLIR